MLEKPAIPDERIVARLAGEYGLSVRQLTFLPLGADVNTAVYRVLTPDETAYFLKMRKGDAETLSIAVPLLLADQGVQAVIAPLETRSRQHWASLDEYKMVLYPFIAGKNGYEVVLSDAQWLDFGAALKNVHNIRVPAALAGRIPRETYSPYWREMVISFQALVENREFADPTAAKLAAFMQAKREDIQRLVARAGQLGRELQTRSLERVLCHADIHPGNLLITAQQGVYIVDWDNPIFAPKERDLALIGGGFTWNVPRQVALFYQGYNRGTEPAEPDPDALTYYRCERIIQDIAAFGQELLLTDAGGEDREQSYAYFTSNFLPNHEIEIALK